MKIWTNTEFTGHYPVGTAAVVVAPTAEDAAIYLTTFLRENNLEDAKAKDMEEMPFEGGQVKILCDGEY